MVRVRHEGPLKETCLCNMHVHKGAKIIAYLNLVFQIISILLLAVSIFIILLGGEAMKRQNHLPDTVVGLIWANIVPIIGLIIGLIVTVLLLQGIKNRNPKMYWPFLIWVAIGIAFLVLSLAFFVISALLVAVGLLAAKNTHGAEFGVAFFVTLLFLIITLALYVYFGFIIVNRSRQLLEAELSGLPISGRHSVPIGHNNPNAYATRNPDNVTVVETQAHNTSSAYKANVY